MLVIFVAGALAGAAGERVLRVDDPPKHARGGELRGGPGPRRLLLDEQFAQELQLTPAQRAQIKAILDRRDVHAKHFWSEIEPRLKAAGDSTRAEIQKVLTAEQIEKLEAEIEKRRAAWKDRHKCHDQDKTERTAGEKVSR